MASALRLITDEITIHLSNPTTNSFQIQNNYVVPRPEGKFLIVAFVNHFLDSSSIPDVIQSAIKNDIGVIYICDKLPSKPICDPHIHYLECPDRWFLHTLFFNPLNFSAVYATRSVKRTALAFSSFTKYNIPILNSESDILKLCNSYVENKDNILVEIIGGVGDHLLTIPSLKTLASLGNTIHILCEPHRNDCFSNLPYIKRIYSNRNEIDVSKFKKIIYLHFGQLLNDYRQDFNKQNRIYAVAELCGLQKSDLVIDKPEIILTKDEKNNAERKWKTYKKKIFIGFDSARIDSKLPTSLTQDLINQLKSRGYTVFVSSNRNKSFQNCIDLNKKLSIRELFSLIAMMDCVLTVDTACVHIAAAFNVKTFCVFNYFKPDWRVGTYKNCVPYIPSVKCFPCCAKQFVPSSEWQCHQKSCYDFQDWPTILTDIKSFFDSGDLLANRRIPVIPNNPTTSSVDESRLPGTLISHPSTDLKIGALWMGGLGDSVMLGYLCRAILRKYPSSTIDAYIRDKQYSQLFMFDYPNIRVKCSKYNWHKTVSTVKDYYDLFFEFRPYPYIWNKDASLNDNFDSCLYNNWQKSTGSILDNVTKQTFLYYGDKVRLDINENDMLIPVRQSLQSIPFEQKFDLPNKYLTFNAGCDNNVGILKLWKKNNWMDLINRLTATGYSVIRVGDDSDENFFGIQKIKCKSMFDLMYLLSRSLLHLGNEGGLIHLAHALGVNSVVLFGPTNPTLYGYPDNINLYFEHCPSCWWTIPNWSQACKKGFATCKNLDALSVDYVYQQVIKRLALCAKSQQKI